MKLDSFSIDILVQGFPGKTVCHGGLGWSTVALVRGRGRVILIDAGNACAACWSSAGHDVPMRLDGDEASYTARRTVGINAWFARKLDDTTLIELKA